MMRMVARFWVLAAVLCLAPLGYAQNYADLAAISSTLGVNANRLCIGEASRGDIGCPTYAPFVSGVGRLGLGTVSPIAAIDVSVTGEGRIRSVGGNTTNGMIWGSASDGASGWGQFYWSDGFGTLLGSGQNLAIFTGGTAGGASERIRITAAGLVGVNTTNPSSTLHVLGEVQVASGGGACNANTAGAIRYTGGTLSYCNSTAWTALTTGTSTPGGVSGSIQFNSAGTFAGNGNMFIDDIGALTLKQTNSGMRIEAGGGSTGNNFAYLDLIGDATYTDFGLRMLRGNGGANTWSQISHRGTGDFYMDTIDQASLVLRTSSTERVRVLPNGSVGIGTSNPGYALTVASGATQYPAAIAVLPSTHPTSRRAAINLDNWTWLQDAYGSGTKDFGLYDGVSASWRLFVEPNGKIGIGTITPASALQVNGEAQVGTSGGACNGTTAGAIRYTGGTLSYCNSSAWTALATGAGVAAINDLNDASKDLPNYNLWLGVEMPTLANNQANTGVGLFALDGLTNTAGANEGDGNSAFGYAALTANTTGFQNTGLGTQALFLNTTGWQNTAVGNYSGYSNTTGTMNTGIGLNTLYYQQTGSYNTAMGGVAMQGTANYSGTGNTAVGYAAHYSAGAATDYNTSVGYATGYNLSTGDYNTLLGGFAGNDITSGQLNTMVGYNTGRGITTGSNNTIIGQGVTGLASSLANNIIIADGSGNRRINIDSSGNMGVDQAAGAYKLEVNGDIVSRQSGAFLRTTGAGGWYSETYGGGWHMIDTTWIRAYGDKNVYTAGIMRADTQLRTGAFCDVSGANCTTPAQLATVVGAGYVAKTGDTMTGLLVSAPTAANFPGDASADTTFEVRGGGGTLPATMAFHRPGAFAAYFGIGNDNSWRVGGWSMGATSYRLWHEGNDGSGSGLDADTLDGWGPNISAGRVRMENVGCGASWASSCDANNSGWTDYADTAGSATDSTKVAKTGDTMSGNLEIQNTAPTITFRDTDHMTGYVHTNSNLMYFMGGPANTGYGGWTTTPLILNLADGRAYMSQVCDPAGANCRTPAQIAASSGASCAGGYTHMQVYSSTWCNGSNYQTDFVQCRNGTNFTIGNVPGGCCSGCGGGGAN